MSPQKSVSLQGLAAGEKGAAISESSECMTISVEQAGRILGISRGAAYAHANDGTIPTIRLGKRILVPKAALSRLLNGAA